MEGESGEGRGVGVVLVVGDLTTSGKFSPFLSPSGSLTSIFWA